MSASLVGSEMCIRDRERAVPCRTGVLLDTNSRLAKRAHEARWAWRPARTVSYTHLTLPTICSV
eukprot:13178184-Alexandrium_andersonii.AAC.1